ncbi:MAG: Xaa-Pro dipeptidase [Porticoccaceae bacterium]|nr:Xaa-Pro dipeptidase [Porticoccaceae bacterium]
MSQIPMPPSQQPPLPELYKQHIADKFSAFLAIMERTGWEHLLISSGAELVQFRDDQHYPFKVNPYFKEWLPLTERPNCYLLISEDEPRPRLYVKQCQDYWHSAPESLREGYADAIEVCPYQDTPALFAQLPRDTRWLAYLGPKMTAMSGFSDTQRNPQALMNQIDWLRAVKSPYEQACMRRANQIAVRGHKAAEKAFKAGKSEVEIQLDYLQAVKCSDQALPYGAIVAVNENAGVLHHTRLQRQAPDEMRSFLLDAGVSVNGYASDITRTHAAKKKSTFARLIAALDKAQQELIDTIVPGMSYVDLHLDMHRRVGEILIEFDVLNCDLNTAMELGLTLPFLPHGLGHLLGVQVHDKGGHQLAPDGGDNPPPLHHPHLRLTRVIEVGQVFTIEPGIYFIPSLLQPVRDGIYSEHVNWQKVDELTPCGGIRIEDNVLVTESGVENFTREAFAAA